MCDILTGDGIVLKIGENIQEEAHRVIDAMGLCALPAFVDMHTHLRQPGYERKEDILSGTLAAANGGYAAVACMPNTNPVNDNPFITNYILGAPAHCKVYPIGAITKNLDGEELAEMGNMKGCVAFSDDGRGVQNGSVMYNALKYAKGLDALIIAHCEDNSLSLGGQINEGFVSAVTGLAGISRAAEITAMVRDIVLASEAGARLHIAHVSTKEGVDLIKDAKAKGVNLTAETCPHYFSATDEEALNFNTDAKVNPPLRTEDDVAAIKVGLLNGTIDCIATDHAPHHADDKNVEFAYAAFGISGLDTAFALTNTFLKPDPQTLVNIMSKRPAEILGVFGGVIGEGLPADITIVDFDTEYVLTKGHLLSKGKNTPFLGRKLKGRVVYTLCDGKLTKDGAL